MKPELVGQATNDVEAIAEFRRHRPDVTLMDLRLPAADGTDILIAIRGEFPDARIVMLSSSGGDGEIHRALRSGSNGAPPDIDVRNSRLIISRTIGALETERAFADCR